MRAPGSGQDVTGLLRRYAEGEAACLDEVVGIVYDELRVLARQQLRRSEVKRHVETAVVVNEAYEKLARGKIQALEDRHHFFAVASRAMRQVVVDTYRAEQAAKRGGGRLSVTTGSRHLLAADDPEQILAVHQALTRLAEHSQDLVDTLDMACFGGLSTEEIAELSGCNIRSVQRKLQRARSWLAHFLREE